MPEVYDSFEKFIEGYVLPYAATYPDRKRLNGDKAGDRSTAAWVLFEGNRYAVHADAIVSSLLAPYRALKAGHVSTAVFVGKTKFGNAKLVPTDGAGDAKGFYIFLGRPLIS